MPLAGQENDGVFRPQDASVLWFWLNCASKILHIVANIQQMSDTHLVQGKGGVQCKAEESVSVS